MLRLAPRLFVLLSCRLTRTAKSRASKTRRGSVIISEAKAMGLVGPFAWATTRDAVMCSAARCAREYRCRRWTTSAPPLLSRRRRWQRRHHVPLEQRLSVHHLPPQRRGESRLKKNRLRAERHGHLRRYVTVGGVLQHPLSLRHRRVPPPHLARGRADRGNKTSSIF